MSQVAGLSRLLFVNATNGDVMKILIARAPGAEPVIIHALGPDTVAGVVAALRHLAAGVAP